MTNADYITLLLYIVGIFVISTLSARRTSNQQDMFSAGRSSPWWASGLSGFMTMFSAGTFVVWGGIAYELGIVAVAINSCYGIAALLVGYFVAGRWNQLQVSTPAEYVQLRFGTTGLHFFTWTMLVKRILGVSVSLYALAKLLVVLIPLDDGNLLQDPTTGTLSLSWAIVFFSAIVVLYTMQGGLWAVLMTDVLQFIVLTIVVLMVAMLMVFGHDSSAPSFSVFRDRVPDSFFSPVAGKYGYFFLFGWITIHFFMIGAEWAFVQRFLAVRSPQDARKSSLLFGVMYLVTPLFWLLPPLLYRGQVEGVDKEQAYMLAAHSVLPPGVVGLMFAAMFSATASMVSSQLNVFAGVLTNDFYRPLLSPNATDKELLRIGRTFTAILGAMLGAMAILVPSMGGAEKLIISINSLLVVPLFAPTLWGLFSKKIGLRHMVFVALTSFAVGLGVRFGLAANPWIVEGNLLWPIANYAAQNTKKVEVLIGVVLPVLMLCFLELKETKTDPRSKSVAERLTNQELAEQTTEEPTIRDAFPQQVVMYSLFCLGIWMLMLGVMTDQGQAVLFICSASLIVVAALIKTLVARANPAAK